MQKGLTTRFKGLDPFSVSIYVVSGLMGTAGYSFKGLGTGVRLLCEDSLFEAVVSKKFSVCS